MPDAAGRAPPLSPVLLAGLAMRPLPPGLLAPALNAAMAVMRRRHPELFERLDGLGEATVLIDPVDLPFRFLLRLEPGAAHLAPLRDGAEAEPYSAAIRGPLLVLIDLLQGRLDGDAAFFSRELAIEGDTEIVVAMRNAIDAAEIDLMDDLLSALGPLGIPARRAIAFGEGVFDRATRDLDALRAAFLAPLARRLDTQAGEIRDLGQSLDRLKATTPRRRAGTVAPVGSGGGAPGGGGET